jgi:hypothetical protein
VEAGWQVDVSDSSSRVHAEEAVIGPGRNHNVRRRWIEIQDWNAVIIDGSFPTS